MGMEIPQRPTRPKRDITTLPPGMPNCRNCGAPPELNKCSYCGTKK